MLVCSYYAMLKGNLNVQLKSAVLFETKKNMTGTDDWGQWKDIWDWQDTRLGADFMKLVPWV